MDFALALSVFGFIFIAELPDKTAMASMVLATRYKPLVVFIGAALAFVIQVLIAILVGGLFALLPESLVHRGAGVLFLVFAFFMWRDNDADDEEAKETKAVKVAGQKFYQGIWATFSVVFLAEWGDLTQLATATLAAKYNDPISVFVGATLALWAVAGIAIVIGSKASKFLKPEITRRVAIIIFVLLGLALLLGIL